MLLERAHRGLLNTIIIVGIGPSFLELWACEVRARVGGKG